MDTQYAEIVDSKPVQRFLLRFYLSDSAIQSLVLISPIVGTLEGTRTTLESVCRKASEKEIPTYVITCEPDAPFHRHAVEILMKHDPVELRYNNSLHAKLYLCLCRDEAQSFALLGSANLTRHSMDNNIEIAVMVHGRGQGRDILRELSRWGLDRLRTISSTRLVKKMKSKGG